MAYRLERATKYLLFAVWPGTIIRGLGLYPGFVFGSASEFFRPDSGLSPYGSIFDFKNPENLYLALGLFISFLLLVFSLKKTEGRKINYSLVFVGHLWIIAAFILPAWARFHFGHGQSFSLRYQYLALPGFFILLAPFVSCLITQKRNVVTQGFFGFYVIAQIYLGYSFDYFTAKGSENRDFIKKLDSSNPSELEKLQVPANLTPGLSVEQIQKNREWLNRFNKP